MPRLPSKRLGRAVLGVGLVALSAACSITTSLDGLTGGVTGGDVTDVDAGSPRADASGGQDALASRDGAGGGGPDGSPGDDAASAGDDAAPGDDGGTMTDTGSPVDTGAPTDAKGDTTTGGGGTGWCAGQTGLLFCADFDEGAKLTSIFDTVSSHGGTASLDTGSPQSAPDVMLIQTTAGASLIDVAGYKLFPSLTLSAGAVLTASLDLRVEQADQTAKSDAVGMEILLTDASGTVWELQLELLWNANAGAFDCAFTENSDLPDGGNPWFQYIPTQRLVFDSWHRFTIELTLGAGGKPSTGQLYDDGVAMFGAPKTMHPTTTNATAQMIAGPSYIASGNSTWNMRIDNVAFSAK